MEAALSGQVVRRISKVADAYKIDLKRSACSPHGAIA
jgi:hypothetical protein